LNSLEEWFVGNPGLIVNLSEVSKIALYVEDGYVTDSLKNKQFGDEGSTYGLTALIFYEVFYILTFRLEDRFQNIVCWGGDVKLEVVTAVA